MPYHGLTMKPAELAAWTTALRSGDFKQSRNVLRRHDGCSCCLGVWAETKQVPKGHQLEHPGDTDFWYTFPVPNPHKTHKSATSLPHEWFAQFFDFDDTGESMDKTNAVAHLIGEFIEMNDDKRFTFAQIADWIDANLTPTTEETTS